jgi:hypothetical protein
VLGTLRAILGISLCGFTAAAGGTGKSLGLYKEGLIDFEAGTSDKS